MRIGIHLPQYGKAIAVGGIQSAARDAEAQGYDDLWVSDHLVVPAERKYPAPFIADPLTALAFAAAATERIGLATSVLVAPQYSSPLQLANTLASLDSLSGGRLTVGLGIGWSEREYNALGAAYRDRGARLDEIIRLFRTVWENSTADFDGTFYPSFTAIRVLPPPAHRIPIWIGGRSEAAVERGLRNDGYHAIDVSPEDAIALVSRLRAARSDDEFTVSVRVNWNVEEQTPAALSDTLAAYRDAGIGAVTICPDRGDIEQWRANQAALAATLH